MEISLGNLRSYFHDINTIHIFDPNKFREIASDYQKFYFDDISRYKEEKNSWDVWVLFNRYSNRIIDQLRFENDYKNIVLIMKSIEPIYDFMFNNKLINIIDYAKFEYNYVYFLEKIENYGFCFIIGHVLILNVSKEKIIDNLCNGDNIPNDKIIALNNKLISYYELIVKLCVQLQLIALKSNNTKQYGIFYREKKNFDEKILYLGNDIQIMTETIPDLEVFCQYAPQYAIINQDKPLLTKIKIFLKALGYTFIRYTTGFGEKPERLFFFFIFLVLFFGIVYSILHWSINIIYFERSYMYLLSLGINMEVLGKTWLEKFFIYLEIFIGIVVINGFIVLIARKYLR